jgi:CHAT domain-containing protein/tetratricopeptide (TPR) repeat protein
MDADPEERFQSEGYRHYLAAGTTRAALVLALLVLGGCAGATAPGATSFGLDDNPDALVARGDGRAALAFFESEAARRARGGAGGLDAAQARVAAARTAELLGAYEPGARHAERALALLDRPGQSLTALMLAIRARLALGSIRLQLNDLDEAERQFETLLALAGSAPVQPGRLAVEALAQVNLAAIAAGRGQRERAIALGGAAARAGEELIARYAGVGAAGGAGAERALAEARDLVGADLGRAHLTVGRAQLELGRLDEAERAFRRAAQFASLSQSPQFGIAARFYLSEVADRGGDTQRGDREAAGALADAARAGLAAVETTIHAHLAERAVARGRHAEALAEYERALRLVEDVRAGLAGAGQRGLFVENKQEIYEGAVRAALALGRAGEAFAYAERARARAFLDMLGTRTVLSRVRAPERSTEEARVRSRLVEAGAATGATATAPAAEGLRSAAGLRDVAGGEYRTFVERVRAEDREQASLMTVEPVTLAEVQGLLPADTTLLEYLVTERETFAWVVDQSRVEVVRLPVGRAALIAEVRALREAIAGLEPLERVREHAARLHGRLVAPALARASGRRLLIVPHDVLHYLPFAALVPGPGRWLVEERTLATVPSASTLRFLGGKGRGGAGGVLIVGNPEVGPGGALPFAEQEARAVGERYPGATVLLRAEATEARVKRLGPAARIIHFATHGELRHDDPLASALRLTPGDGEDGRLEVREIFRWALDAELVVLSACETGLGRLSRGDELLGLQRAFLYAGTPAVVTTLWKVEDRSSFRLMRLFHERLPADGPARALQAAQAQTLREFPHPFYWAAFGLAGGPGAR